MLNNQTIAVVVPAYNEETQIGKVIETMPEFVDRIVIVNDKSKDKTAEVIKKYIKEQKRYLESIKNNNEKKIIETEYNRAEIVSLEMIKQEKTFYTPHEIVNTNEENDRIILINHLENGGVGSAIATGYKWCRDNKISCTAVMAGDGQMDPNELESICTPVVNEGVDYVKGNRLSHRSAFFVVPKIRYFGNSVLSLMTKIASGYWHVSDTQTGYTAISLSALEAIRLHKIYKSYGCPNDILVKLNIAFCTLKEIPIKPVYDVGEKSKMKIIKVIPRISLLLFWSFWKRLYIKYLLRDFHPLFMLYHFGFFLLVINIPYTIKVFYSVLPGVTLPLQVLMIFVFLSISGFQSLFFAMWMDMMDNERLQKY